MPGGENGGFGFRRRGGFDGSRDLEEGGETGEAQSALDVGRAGDDEEAALHAAQFLPVGEKDADAAGAEKSDAGEMQADIVEAVADGLLEGFAERGAPGGVEAATHD